MRHRGKIEAAINNARCHGALCQEFGSLGAFIWSFAPAVHERSIRLSRAAIPATSASSTAMSKALKQRGWKFVGPTTMYALFQAMGLVNDHLDGCFRRPAIERARSAAGALRDPERR